MSVSYGYCELRLGSTGNALFASLWQQAAAQGMSVFVASGDSGSAMCDEHDQTPPDVASDGLQVNGIASTPYNTAVGGTDFNWFNLRATKTYWGANNPTNHSSALGYIPEIPWNESCETPSVVAAYELATLDESPLLSCEYAYASGEDENLVTVGGGGGGVSACTEPTGTTPADCAGGYAKPSWQAGVGVPDDKKRDVPDVALFSAFTTLGNAYLICDSESVPCDYGNIDDLVAQAIGGTSAASPAMAGIMALVVQKMGERQGNANPSLYALAAKDDRANCNSAKVAAGNACNFYDITTDNNAQPCYVPPPPLAISPNCTAPPGPPSGYTETNYLVGVLTGYASGTGYDLATGLGSINAYNLVNNWHTVASAQPYIYLNPATLTFAATLEGTAAADQTVTLENLGKAALSISSVTLGGADASSFSIAKNGCTKALAASASCTLTVGFKPKAAGALTASVLIDDNVTNDSPSSIALTGTGAVTTVTLAPSLAFGSAAVGSTSAAKTVTLENTGKDKLSISSIALGGADPSSFAIASKTCGSALDAGASCNISVEFKPKSAKALTGTLTVTDNALASPQSVTLSGTGTGT